MGFNLGASIKSAFGKETIQFIKSPTKSNFKNIITKGAASSTFGLNGGYDEAPKPPTAIAPPNIDSAQVAAEQNSDMLRRRKGRASTILTGQDGAVPDSSNIATKILLGM